MEPKFRRGVLPTCGPSDRVATDALNLRMNLRNHSLQKLLLPFAQSHERVAGPRAAGHLASARQDAAARDTGGTVIESDIAPRLDRLPWDRFHTLVVVALGITWVL